MKKIKTNRIVLILVLVFLGSIQTSQAQFFKKLKQRAEEAAKEAILRKAEEKAARSAEKSMDKILNFDFSTKSEDPSILPASYQFEWKYILQMEADKKNFNMVYFLKPDAKYFGSKPELGKNKQAGNMFMVLDENLKVMTLFTDINGRKTGHILPVNQDLQVTDEDENKEMAGFTFKEIEAKTILGHECQGFEFENKEYKMIMYVTFDAPVSFNQVFGSHVKNTPKGFNPKWLEMADNSLVMEMNFINKNKKKFNTKMVCVSLENTPTSINIGDYEFMSTDTTMLTEE